MAPSIVTKWSRMPFLDEGSLSVVAPEESLLALEVVALEEDFLEDLGADDSEFFCSNSACFRLFSSLNFSTSETKLDNTVDPGNKKPAYKKYPLIVNTHLGPDCLFNTF